MATILVIDDEAGVRTMIRRILVSAGHQVLEAVNGRQGLDLFSHKHPDLVISDIVMPDEEGISTIRRVRQANHAVPILAISGGGSSGGMEYLRMATSLGANASLPKPFGAMTLIDTVAGLLAPVAAND